MNVDTYTLSNSRYGIRCVNGVPREFAERCLADPSSLLPAAVRTAPWPDETPARSAIVPTEIGDVFVKQQRRTPWKAALDALGRRRSPALKAFLTGQVLLAAGVRAVRPLAVLERRRPGETFLLLEKVDGVDLRSYLIDKLPGLEGERERRRLCRSLWRRLADTVAGLHEAGVRQRDLKAPNILVAEDGEGAPEIVLVDLEGMHYLGRLPHRRIRARDLSRLGVSLQAEAVSRAGVAASEWEFVLSCYLEATKRQGVDDGDLSWWVHTTREWARKKTRRNRRAGRVIH